MLLLTETVLFYWDMVDASSSSKEGDACHGLEIRDWAQKNVKSSISGTQRSVSHVTSASNSQGILLFAHSKVLGVKVKGSTKSSRSIATQPPATPASAAGLDLPISYFDEEDDTSAFTNPTQETAKEWGVSYCYSMITDTEVTCATGIHRSHGDRWFPIPFYHPTTALPTMYCCQAFGDRKASEELCIIVL